MARTSLSSMPSSSLCSSSAKGSRPRCRRCRPTTLPERWASRKRRTRRLLLDPQDLDERVGRLELLGRASGKDQGIVDLVGKLAVVTERQVDLAGCEPELILDSAGILSEVLPGLDHLPYVEWRTDDPRPPPVVRSPEGDSRI